MKYNELTISKQSQRGRVGRGISAGRGKTAGRGTKGQGSRKSGGVRPGFEGGQVPLYIKLPHLRGFKTRRIASENIYTGQLELVKKSVIDNLALSNVGLVSNPYTSVKLLNKGEIGTKKEVKLQAASKKAIKALEKAGGSFTEIERQGRPAAKKIED